MNSLFFSSKHNITTGSLFSVLPPRVRAKISIAGECWTWIGDRNAQGYGRLHLKGFVSEKAHRIVFELLTGPIPRGLTLDHLCRNRACVNPAHLEPVTLQENLRRGTGVGVVNAAKSHCRRGHEFTLKNTYFTGTGKRACRTCMRAATERWTERKVIGAPAMKTGPAPDRNTNQIPIPRGGCSSVSCLLPNPANIYGGFHVVHRPNRIRVCGHERGPAASCQSGSDAQGLQSRPRSAVRYCNRGRHALPPESSRRLATRRSESHEARTREASAC